MNKLKTGYNSGHFEGHPQVGDTFVPCATFRTNGTNLKVTETY